jgi:hypothetical protein
MSGKDRLSREPDREESSSLRRSEFNFGLICIVALAALALLFALMFPDVGSDPIGLLSGP